MNTFGRRFRTTILGTSHGPFVGCVIEGLRSGEPIDLSEVQQQLNRRRPGQSAVTSQRQEEDLVEIHQGMIDGKATGEPIVAVVKNKDVRSEHYSNVPVVPRPGHGDFTAAAKYGGLSDLRGGGQLSGRMTVPLVISGAMARQVLARKGMEFYAHAVKIGHVNAGPVTVEEIRENVEKTPVRCADLQAAARMIEEVERARRELDSVGGIIEARILGVPAGVGEPFYDSVESVLSHLMFSIPAVKGVEFGSGFACAEMRGSQHNDPFIVKDGKVQTATNNAGGVLGGITNGMPIVFRVAIKPTASIARKQRSVNLKTMTEEEIEVKGRHDPCIVPRAVPVVENAAAMAMLDLFMVGDLI